MEVSLKHKLKRLLIKYKLLSFFLPVYKTFIYFSPFYRTKQKEDKKNLLNFYSQFIKAGDLCFDVGANKGNVTDVFLELGAKVIAVEPQPKCIKYLKKRFGNKPEFTLVGKGLSDKEGKLTLFICKEADNLSTFSDNWNEVFPNHKWLEKKIVQVTTLDDLIKKFGMPIFCKIDVEGYETKVLKGLSQPIPSLSFEFTKKTADKTENCLVRLKSLGYKQFNFHFGKPRQLFLSNWVSKEELVKKIESAEGSILGGDIYAKL